MAKNNVQSVSYLLCTQVIKPKLFQKHKINLDTNPHKTKNTQTSNTKFSKIRPFSIANVEKKRTHRARTRWYRGPFRRFTNARLKLFFSKEWTETIKKIKYYITAKQQIPVPYGSILHIPPTNLLLLAAKQELYTRKKPIS